MGWWDWVPRKVEEPEWVVCVECRVHFEPDGASQFAEYCLVHRRPKIEAQRREDDLVHWTRRHLDLVEKVKAREDKKEASRLKKTPIDVPSSLGLSQKDYASLAALQQMAWNGFHDAFMRPSGR